MAVELLSPAGNVDIARSAILSGADAVYIGPERFGARKSASNSMDDIARLLDFAHLFEVKVYLTMNTILFDDELEEAQRMAERAEEIGVDALIVQDMAYQSMGLKRIPLHASTQTFNFDLDKIKLIASSGFDRVVLERSLSLEEIRRIHSEVPVELEAFIHGAMCVGMSGRCYLSQYLSGRSGNRGVCAQPCRNSYRLTTVDGKVLAESSPLLSVSDINLSDRISSLIDAGIVSFKIEGRLKDESYVINNTAYYSAILDKLGVERSSKGERSCSFNPDPRKSFSRGTSGHMFLDNPRAKVGAATKSLGEPLGNVVSVSGNRMTISSSAENLHNGDGVCWSSDIQSGAYINGIQGNNILLSSATGLSVGQMLYRNYDKTFSVSLRNVKRTIPADLCISVEESRLVLSVNDFKVGYRVEMSEARNKELAVRNITNSLSKTGDWAVYFRSISLPETVPFIAVSSLNSIRRNFLSSLQAHIISDYILPRRICFPDANLHFPKDLSYEWNVSNYLSKLFYESHGARNIEPALELQSDLRGKTVMQSRHCIRRQMGLCNHLSSAEPLYLENNGRKLEVRFDCSRCIMNIIPR